MELYFYLTILLVLGNTQLESFSKAKRILFEQVYAGHRETFYCRCKFDSKKQIDLDSCGYRPTSKSKRAMRIEWDHVVPAEAFGQSFVEWREGHPSCKGKGRKCAEKVNQTYRLMQADLYNLVPAEGAINAARSNFSMAMLAGTESSFGSCLVKIADRKFEPPSDVRGDIARIYFYMDATYPGHGIISGKNRPLFEAWDKQDPVDRWECVRAALIEEIQGNKNQFINCE